MSVINKSLRCDCGHSKAESWQFCGRCWNKAPESLKDKFRLRVQELRNCIEEIKTLIGDRKA